ncbi:MAG: hypothetical protein WD045_12420 [Pirellulaceae bacterium]
MTTTTVMTSMTAAAVATSEQTTTGAVMTATTVAHSNAAATVTGVSLTLATDHRQTNNREKDRDTKTKNAIHVRILQKLTLGY